MNQSRKRRIILMCAAVALFLLTMIRSYPDASDNPDQEMIRGENWSISGQRGERRELIHQCEGTSALIYFSYAHTACIDAYDHSGQYRFTISVPDAEKGILTIDCGEDLLYAKAATGDVFIFRGTELIESMDRQTAKARGYRISDLNNESGYAITRTHVVRVEGEALTELFPLPEEIRENLPIVTLTPDQSGVIRNMLLVGFVIAWAAVAGYSIRGVWLGFRKKKR